MAPPEHDPRFCLLCKEASLAKGAAAVSELLIAAGSLEDFGEPLTRLTTQD